MVLLGFSGKGQDFIESPKNLGIYQRTNNNLGVMPIQLGGLSDVKTLKISLSQVLNSDIVVNEFVKDFNIPKSSFDTTLVLEGGWYLLKAEIIKNDGTTVSEEIKTGIGEIFLVAGQSNAEFEGPVAIDERVVGAYYSQNPTFFSIVESDDPRWLYPSAPGTSFLGVLGDSLVKRLGVPVLFFNSASGGTSSRDWWSSSFTGGLPYQKVDLVINQFLNHHGVRAVLWHQGEANSMSYGYRASKELYRDELLAVIQKSREGLNFGKLGWVIAQASWSKYQIYGPGDPNDPNKIEFRIPTRAGQLLLTQADDNIFLGPDSDLIEGYAGSVNRDDGVHMSYIGQALHAQLWSNALSTEFFNNGTPYIAKKIDQTLSNISWIPEENCFWQKIRLESNAGIPLNFSIVSGDGLISNDSLKMTNIGDSLKLEISNEGNQLYKPYESRILSYKFDEYLEKPDSLLVREAYFRHEPVQLISRCSAGIPNWFIRTSLLEPIAVGDLFTFNMNGDSTFIIKCTKDACLSPITIKYILMESTCISNPVLPDIIDVPFFEANSSSKIIYDKKVGSLSDVTFNARNHLLLLPGFETSSGSMFKGLISNCPN
ncbi:MAG: hypothetical protein ACI9DJ_001449 [Algoriphagus sp.]